MLPVCPPEFIHWQAGLFTANCNIWRLLLSTTCGHLSTTVYLFTGKPVYLQLTAISGGCYYPPPAGASVCHCLFTGKPAYSQLTAVFEDCDYSPLVDASGLGWSPHWRSYTCVWRSLACPGNKSDYLMSAPGIGAIWSLAMADTSDSLKERAAWKKSSLGQPL